MKTLLKIAIALLYIFGAINGNLALVLVATVLVIFALFAAIGRRNANKE